MEKESKRFLSSLLAIVLLFFTIQNLDAVKLGVGYVMDLIMPLLYGCVIAFILNLIVRQLERFLTFGPFRNRIFRRIVSVLLSFCAVAGVVAGIVAGLAPQIRDSATLLVTKAPGFVTDVLDFLVGTVGLPEAWFSDLRNFDVAGFLQTLFQSGTIQKILASGGNFVGGAVSSVVDLALGVVFSVYVLMSKERISRSVKRLLKAYLKPASYDSLLHIISTMNMIYSSFISGQCLDAMILGTMVGVVLAILGIDYALLIGILIAVTALVPIVGAFLGGAISIFLLLMISFKSALIFLIVFILLQQVDNHLIYPHVVGGSVGLPAVWIFAAVVVGGNMGGIFGMLLAIPLFALIYTLLSQNVAKREEEAAKCAAVEESEREEG